MQTRIWLGDLREGQVIRRAIKTAILVGTTLVAITQGVSIIAGEFSSRMAWQIPLTVMVPFTVSLLTSATVVGSARRANAAVREALKNQLETINKFPNLNPNPVMRMTPEGRLEYANAAGAPVVSAMGMEVGDLFSLEMLGKIEALRSGNSTEPLEVSGAGRGPTR